MSQYETILYEIADGVATITFNRPDKYNAFNDTQIVETTAAFRQASKDSAVRAVVLTGSGKAFCSGQDLGNVGERELSFLEHVREKYNPMILQMRSLEKPIIGAINGVAAGAGMSVALACDLRVASSQSSFIFAAFSRIGLVPDNGMTYFLPRLLGPAKAYELMVLADAKNRLSPSEALALGLCTKVIEAEQFAEGVHDFAKDLAKLPTRALGLTKRMINAAWDNTLAQALDLEAQLQEAASRTADAKEGVLAFLEKREANFTGQ